MQNPRSVKFQHQFRLLLTIGCMNAIWPHSQNARVACVECCARCHCFVPIVAAAEEVAAATAKSAKLFSGTTTVTFA